MKKLLTYGLILLLGHIASAQADSSRVLTFNEYMQRVRQHHPLARMANNAVRMGDAYVQKSRGAFDPKLHGDIQQKYYSDQQYYSIMDAGLKIPTWFGVSFQAGYDQTDGVYLNPERTLPDDGLWYAGINLNLGRGLIIDERRAQLKKAKIYFNSSIQQQRLLLNELYLQSATAYWEWFKAYNKMKVYQEAVENALVRFEAVKRSAEVGDKPNIDTLEASIQLQSRTFNYLDAELEFKNASALLEIYMWDDGFIPLELDSLTVPPLSPNVEVSPLDPELILQLDSIAQFHPTLLKKQFDIDQKRVDLKLSQNNLLPEVNLKYNAITAAGTGDVFDGYSIHNYAWGADFSFPIFIRKQRAQLKLNKLQIDNLESDLFFKTEEISFKIEMSVNQWSTTFQQVSLWTNTTADYLRLLESERVLFNIGESSLFMVNSREKAYINARLQLIEKLSDNKKAMIKTRHAMGNLDQLF